MRHGIKRPAYINQWRKISKLQSMLKLLWLNKSLYIIYQQINIVNYVKYCWKPNEKVLTDKILYSLILRKRPPLPRQNT